MFDEPTNALTRKEFANRTHDDAGTVGVPVQLQSAPQLVLSNMDGTPHVSVQLVEIVTLLFRRLIHGRIDLATRTK
jgi:hypothetical protein